MIEGHESGSHLHSTVDDDQVEVEGQNGRPKKRHERRPAGKGGLRFAQLLKYVAFSRVRLVKVREKVCRAHNVAGSADEIGNGQASDDFLSSGSHVFQSEERDHDKDGAETGETTRHDGNVAGKGPILNADKASCAVSG